MKLPERSKFSGNFPGKIEMFLTGSTTLPDFKPDWRRWIRLFLASIGLYTIVPALNNGIYTLCDSDECCYRPIALFPEIPEFVRSMPTYSWSVSFAVAIISIKTVKRLTDAVSCFIYIVIISTVITLLSLSRAIYAGGFYQFSPNNDSSLNRISRNQSCKWCNYAVAKLSDMRVIMF